MIAFIETLQNLAAEIKREKKRNYGGIKQGLGSKLV